jgi:hypothetical protein
MLEQIRKRNPGLRVFATDDPAFKKFGTIVDGYDYSELLPYIENKTAMPDSGNSYVADLPETHSMAVFSRLRDGFFGAMPIQLGFSNGHNDQLNALEYHKSSELLIAATDCVLLLASLQDIEDGKLDSRKIRAFYVAKGQAVELYAPTLHFAPCAVSTEGYKTAVVLPKGTNTPLQAKSKTEPMLRMSNKWLIAHPDCERFASSGAYLGIRGENIQIKF